MIKQIGITGQAGFIGKHLYNTLRLYPEEFKMIDFERSYFEDEKRLDEFVGKCDVIVHLAAMNRHSDPEVIYTTNLALVEKLVASLKRTGSKAHVIFSSSTQEERDNHYGRSKKAGRELMIQWAEESEGKFSGLIIPNVFGPFGLPNYNSVVATFCYKLTHDETPKIDVDGELKLIYVGELANKIIEELRAGESNLEVLVPHTAENKVSELLLRLEDYKAQYLENGIIPQLENRFEINLFNTFRSYIDLKNFFPVKFTRHTDPRGSFVEVIRLNVGGQVSFSTTVPGITRGNHFHTRKIERFAVIKGKASIQLRQIGTDEVLYFELDGNEPAYVDMPVWYTHNIKNTGEEELYTIFWINEFYDPEDADTYFEDV
ncbi:MAG: polysaccharide biosynthesis C-terminal domain-containing protein [Ginsengibacter sp.]